MLRVWKHPLVWGCLLLTAVTILNNWPMAAFGFAWDDHGYVVRNYPIQDPVSLKSILWCLSAFAEANWHPMTWLALHIQFQFFGLNPGGYHVVNLLLHLANTLLLYALLFRTTRAVGKSLAVAALFSVHPLHIESVAWISEIKDVLSTFFFLLTLHAYVGYARRPGPGRYGLVCLSLACGLAAKPMLVTAPFVLALLDYWPLGRWLAGPAAALESPTVPRFGTRRLILEKLPLLAMSAAVCVLTFLAQREGGAVVNLATVPLFMRISNVANSYLLYLWRMAWPWPLSFFYTQAPIPVWRFLLCLLGLASLCLLIWRARKNNPYLLFGWLWFLGTLIPVIGLVQVGSQALADRYTYIPSIGCFIAAAWLVDNLRKRTRMSLLLPFVATGALIFVYMCVSLDYLLNWINEEQLYQHALAVDSENNIALNNYGIVLLKNLDVENAIKQFERNLESNPNALGARNNLARIALMQGKLGDALDYALPTLRSHPYNSASYAVPGEIFFQARDDELAKQLFIKSLVLPPVKLQTAVLLADILIRQRHFDNALAVVRQYMELAYDKDPAKAMLQWCAGQAYAFKGERENSRKAFEEALRLQTNFPQARQGLARLAIAENNLSAAATILKGSLSLFPTDAATQAMLGHIYLKQGQRSRAYVQLRRALNANQKIPFATDIAQAALDLAALQQGYGRPDEAAINVALAHDRMRLAYPPDVFSLRDKLTKALAPVQPAP